ncbi:MAG: Ada metal-binding domain-containing protein [Cyclobacteriaceae bacterium]
MIKYYSHMFKHLDINQSIFRLIRRKEIQLAGNIRLKIYGRLHCKSGKRMKKENRVFFRNEAEALELGFRPCKNCMKDVR